MDLIRPLLYILSFLALFTCGLSWFAFFAYIARWQTHWTVVDLQSRLLAWTSENGYTIIRQERPPKASLRHRIAVSGPLPWLVLPSGTPWAFDVHRRTIGICVPVLSTHLTLEDREGRTRRGQMKYFGRQYGAFWRGPVESRWEEDDVEPSAPTEQAPLLARFDPLWDPWVDS
jgi:hypothetical protein